MPAGVPGTFVNNEAQTWESIKQIINLERTPDFILCMKKLKS